MNFFKIVVFSILIIILLNKKIIKAQENVATTDEYKYENNGDGTYNFRFVTSDGTEREESGKFEGEGNYVVRGYYSFIDPEGNKHYVNYVADNTGYHPTISDTPPSMPVYTQALPPAAVATLLG